MIYVYNILEHAASSADDIRGIDGEPVYFEDSGALRVACTGHDAASILPTAQNVLQHERVVEQLMRGGALLPARFGTTFQSAQLLAESLSRHQAQLIDALDRVRGCDEIGVRVLWPPQQDATGDESPPQTGREYLLSRAAQEKRGSQFEERATTLHERLSRLAKASTRRFLRTPSSLLSAAYLIERDRTAGFREAVCELAAANADLRLLCTGPWPPYNFAPSLAPAEARHVG